jgi:hypothetical protein
MMPSNQEYKGTGMKGRSDDESSGYQGGRQGSQQSGQPDQQRGDDGDRKLARKQERQDDIGTARPSER